MVDGIGHVCNNFFHTMMKQITFKINGTIVSPQTNEYTYNAYIETLLNYDTEQKSSVPANTLWSKDQTVALKLTNRKEPCNSIYC